MGVDARHERLQRRASSAAGGGSLPRARLSPPLSAARISGLDSRGDQYDPPISQPAMLGRVVLSRRAIPKPNLVTMRLVHDLDRHNNPISYPFTARPDRIERKFVSSGGCAGVLGPRHSSAARSRITTGPRLAPQT